MPEAVAAAGATELADAATHHAQLHGRTVRLEQDLLARNQLLAERNRGWFAGRGVLVCSDERNHARKTVSKDFAVFSNGDLTEKSR